MAARPRPRTAASAPGPESEAWAYRGAFWAVAALVLVALAFPYVLPLFY